MMHDWNPWIALGIFLIAQLVASVWWASGVNTTLTFMKDAVERIEKNIAAGEENYVKKDDMKRETFLADREHGDLWKRVNQNTEDISKIREKIGSV